MSTSPLRGRPAFYATLYPNLVEVARECGYTLALHGSLRRDMDVIAVPWIEDAVTASMFGSPFCE